MGKRRKLLCVVFFQIHSHAAVSEANACGQGKKKLICGQDIIFCPFTNLHVSYNVGDRPFTLRKDNLKEDKSMPLNYRLQ